MNYFAIVAVFGIGVCAYIKRESIVMSALRFYTNIEHERKKYKKKHPKIKKEKPILLESILIKGDFLEYNYNFSKKQIELKNIDNFINNQIVEINNDRMEMHNYVGIVNLKLKYKFNNNFYYFLTTGILNESINKLKSFLCGLKKEDIKESRILSATIMINEKESENKKDDNKDNTKNIQKIIDKMNEAKRKK